MESCEGNFPAAILVDLSECLGFRTLWPPVDWNFLF